MSKAMSRNRFQIIKSCIHFADNQQLEEDNKVAKVQPLHTSLIQQLTQYGVFHEMLSIDESMVLYYGRHSAKMFIRGKPIRFGFKLWSLCGSDGYPHNLKTYRGMESGQQQTPFGTLVVNGTVEMVREH